MSTYKLNHVFISYSMICYKSVSVVTICSHNLKEFTRVHMDCFHSLCYPFGICFLNHWPKNVSCLIKRKCNWLKYKVLCVQLVTSNIQFVKHYLGMSVYFNNYKLVYGYLYVYKIVMWIVTFLSRFCFTGQYREYIWN